MTKKNKPRPVQSYDLPGMSDAIKAQGDAAAVYQAEELTAKLLEPLGNIDQRAGLLETDSPLFFGKINPTLF